MPLVSLSNIVVARSGTTILDGIDLDIESGEIVGVSGSNGSGKTTLLRTMATLVPPNAGNGTVLEARLGTPDIYRVRPLIGLAGHQATLVPELTLGENLRHFARLAGIDQDLVPEVLEVVGLADAAGLAAARCSNGMKRRTDLARLWMSSCRLLLLDEPEAGLDDDAVAIVDALIKRCVARGGGAVVVSHDAGALHGRCSRTREMKDGLLQ